VAAPLAALWAAVLIGLSLALPVLAVEGPTKLFGPSASPNAGLPTTTISFAVTYRNRNGTAPDHVSVIIDGSPHAMTRDGTSNWKQGVPHSWATKLPVGAHSFSFEAADTSKFSGTIAGGTVTISAPPASTPGPPPMPAAAEGSSAAPPPTQTPGDITAGGPGTMPSASPAGGDGAPVPRASSDGSGGSAGIGTTPGAGSGDLSGGPAGSGRSGDAATAGAGWGSLVNALRLLGIDQPPSITAWPMLVGTTGAVTMAFAFAIFGKKRRDEQPPSPDEVLKAGAARGDDGMPRAVVAAGTIRAPAGPTVLDAEAGMPRWRRPSLLQARKADPARYVATVPRMSFEHAAAGTAVSAAAAGDSEQRVIRYRLVRLLDAPDELRSAEIGQLDQGDEVRLLERSGSYWLVLCPDGRQGWLHKMTLGEPVGDSVASPFGNDVDDDVLTAFIQARARA